MNLYVKSCPRSIPNYIFIEIVLKTYFDKLYFYKLYDEFMHQSCSCLRRFCGSYVQSYHLVRRIKNLCVKFVRVMLKNCHISWLEKFMRKSCKYRKSCAAKLSSNSCVEKNYT